ncbi:DNA-deoxyinosine glycosylase [Ileibacterium valens]|uniref:DNA-deoxyinosine glycosylase n=1 Tax=Ileibacterium valens TaxID=1862668 RepID=UPI0024BBB8BB|nr:DNA-deoxyinosine glycosylase [Ileibacterium valens]
MFNDSDLQEYRALAPAIYPDCTTLVLVSMPSVDSEVDQFYFADSSNRFWPVMGAIFNMPSETKEERLAILEQNHVGIWSVVKSCMRYLSREDTMQDIVLNDISGFLKEHPSIKRIVCVSHDALRLLQEADGQAAAIACYVPSPSAADLWYDSVEKLAPEYQKAFGLNSEF